MHLDLHDPNDLNGLLSLYMSRVLSSCFANGLSHTAFTCAVSVALDRLKKRGFKTQEEVYTDFPTLAMSEYTMSMNLPQLKLVLFFEVEAGEQTLKPHQEAKVMEEACLLRAFFHQVSGGRALLEHVKNGLIEVNVSIAKEPDVVYGSWLVLALLHRLPVTGYDVIYTLVNKVGDITLNYLYRQTQGISETHPLRKPLLILFSGTDEKNRCLADLIGDVTQDPKAVLRWFRLAGVVLDGLQAITHTQLRYTPSHNLVAKPDSYRWFQQIKSTLYTSIMPITKTMEGINFLLQQFNHIGYEFFTCDSLRNKRRDGLPEDGSALLVFVFANCLDDLLIYNKLFIKIESLDSLNIHCLLLNSLRKTIEHIPFCFKQAVLSAEAKIANPLTSPLFKTLIGNIAYLLPRRESYEATEYKDVVLWLQSMVLVLLRNLDPDESQDLLFTLGGKVGDTFLAAPQQRKLLLQRFLENPKLRSKTLSVLTDPNIDPDHNELGLPPKTIRLLLNLRVDFEALTA